ncbi:UPF0182 family protein [Chloroflexota bacterium]
MLYRHDSPGKIKSDIKAGVSKLSTFDRQQWQRWFPEDREDKPPPSGLHGWTAGRVIMIMAGLLFLFIIVNTIKGFYTEWLWFDNLGYGSVYSTILRTRMLIFFIAAIIFGILVWGNLVLATRLSPKGRANIWPWAVMGYLQRLVKLNVILGTVLLSLIFGLVAQSNWQVFLRFFSGQPFGVTDPVFFKEVSFYVFSLPFFQLLQGWFIGALVVTILSTAIVYTLSYAVQRTRFDFARPVLAHIGGLVIAVLLLITWGYWLGIWELVFSERGVVFGASYTDMHAQLPAQWILIVALLICIGTTVAAILRRKLRWVAYAIGGWIAIAIVGGGIFPAIVQRFQVQPSELVREKPYIEYNIQYTDKAYALNNIEEKPFPAEEAPSRQDLAENEVTINNIRLWDSRPLKDTYNQIQSFRLYYDFNDVDVDRYSIDGEYRQVMLSAREMSAEKLSGQAQTWVNRKLQFTHGYGVALSPVNEISAQGLPVLMVKDIPPMGNFEIERPQIYFGEKTDDYVIVNTKTEEFDYPSGDENIYGKYQGSGGVSLNGIIRRFIYAWQLGDLNILISNELDTESSVLYYRNIQERVSHLAPFLRLDSDPYLVIADGRLFWIQDAYTTTNRYPYSEPTAGSINYIRNSVKAVIDAYNGDVTFYVFEPDDALIQTYQTIFPDLFVPADQMPDSLREHIRYPEGMFKIQASVYQSYHMKDARVFYNKEDLWALPREVYAGKEQTLEPYYIIMRLPGDEQEEFLLMQPFTPVNKNNTISWMAARSDGENYGKLLVYSFPKERLIYGPSQIENRIQQDTIITEQLALWGRGGSRVIRGNLLFIPIGKSYIYVEPVFLQAESGGLPELKRVIVAIGEQITMEPTLGESLAAILGMEPPPAPPPVSPAPTPIPPAPGEMDITDIARLITEAQQHYDQAQQYQREGNWAEYGKELDALQAVLEQLAKLTGK